MATTQAEFGRNLALFLLERKLTRRQVAEEIHCTGATVGRWVRGEGPYVLACLALLRKKYGADLNKLICGSAD